MYLLTPCPGRSGTDLAELPHLEPSQRTRGQRSKPHHTSRRPVQRGSPRHVLPNFPPRPLNLPTGPPAAPPDSPRARHPTLRPPLPFRPVASRIAARGLQPRPPRLQHPPPGRPAVVLTRLVPPSLCCWVWGCFVADLCWSLVCVVVSFFFFFFFVCFFF